LKPDGDLAIDLGDHQLSSPLVAASGTVGSVAEFAPVADVTVYGAMVAKSVSATPWAGREAPRLGAAGTGMLNAIGIQNPGIEAWVDEVGPTLASLPTEVWGSAVGKTPEEFATVAAHLGNTTIGAIEVNLSCPNLEDGIMFALDPKAAFQVVAAVRGATSLPIGAKLSPNAEDIVAVADAVAGAGADWVVVGNTVWGAAIDIETRRPVLRSVVGGYSGSPIKPIALRGVWQVHQALPELPIVGTGGVSHGDDVVEFLLAGASAVGVGSAHFADPKIGAKIIRQLRKYLTRHGIGAVAELIGGAQPW
jgi:dihydroorotate dehydrogenase (NAD+) catalytic subunit